MNFLDLKNLTIADKNDFVSLKVIVDGEKLLDMPLSESPAYLKKIFNINYKGSSVFIDVVIKNLIIAEDTVDTKEYEFEILCEMIVPTILNRNKTNKERQEKEKNKIMNKLPSGLWNISPSVTNRINAPISVIRQCGDYKMVNKEINIEIHTENNELLYRFID